MSKPSRGIVRIVRIRFGFRVSSSTLLAWRTPHHTTPHHTTDTDTDTDTDMTHTHKTHTHTYTQVLHTQHTHTHVQCIISMQAHSRLSPCKLRHLLW